MDRVFSISTGLAFLGLVALVVIFSGGATATNDPPPSGGTVTGDWTVTDTKAYNGVTITLEGNLNITSGGTLVLDGARLVMGGTGQGQYGIDVRSGGRMVLQNGANLSASSAAYRFSVESGGALNVTDSELRGCGYSWGSGGETAGIFIESDSFSLTRALVAGGYYGVVVSGASPAFSGCHFTGNSYGAAAVNSSASFVNCSFTYNTNGANLESCSGTFTDCMFAQNTGFGLLAYRSTAAFSRCDFLANPSGNCVLMGSDASFSNCTFRDGAYGAYVTLGRPAFTSCTLGGNRYGMYLYRSTASVTDSLFIRNNWYAVSSYFGEPSLLRCELSYTGYSDVDGVAYGSGIGAFSSNLSMTGGSLHHNYQGVECRYGSPRLSGVELRDNDYSLWAYQSSPEVAGCNFTRARVCGAFLGFFCGGSFDGCRFQDSATGACLDNLGTTQFLNSTFRACRYGVWFESGGEAAIVQGCSFDQNGFGAYLSVSSSTVASNRFGDNINGSIFCRGSSITVRGNTFSACEADALQLQDCAGLVEGNTFDHNNATAVYCVDSITVIANNTFSSNGGSGVHITGKKSSPEVRDNLFAQNALGVAFTKQSAGTVHNNRFKGNAQAGVTVQASSGELYCNTVTGSIVGISCDAGSSPSIHDNRIFDNEGGVVCHTSSDADIRGNLILDNARFGIEAVAASPFITGNNISGSRDGVRIQGAGTGPVSLDGNLVQNNTDGVWVDGASVELRDCNFTGNRDAGVLSAGADILANRCTFYRNEDGLYASGGSATVQECDFIQNNNTGVLAEAAAASVRGCFFFQNTGGVMDLGNSTLDVYDGVYEQNLAYALYWADTTRGDWWLEKAASSVDDRFRLAGNLTVFEGASLRLVNASVFMMLGAPGEHSIEVRNGGRLEILQGSVVTSAAGSYNYPLRVLAGGNLTFQDGGLERCGEYSGLGGSLERGGLSLLSSEVTLRGVTFRDCGFGIIASGITATFQYLMFVQCDCAVEAVASSLRIDNSTIFQKAERTDLQLQQASRVMLVNTETRDPQNHLARPSASILGPGCELSVFWYLDVNTVWQNKVVAPRTQVTLDDARGGRQLAGYTDEKGWLQWIMVLQYIQNFTATDERNPYTLGARLGNVTRTQDHAFTESWPWYCELQDLLPPVLQVDFPQTGARLNYTPVTVSGLAHDFETGLTRLEWSTDGRIYEAANGSERWSAVAALPDGNRTVFIRATDAVGNQASTNVSFSIKTRITVLDISSPAEGQVTRSPALQVTGLTDIEARLQVNGRDIGLSQGRFSTTVYLVEGNNTVLVSASDDAGNTATVARRVVLDTEPPVVEVLSPRNGSYLAIAQAVVTGRTEPGARVTVDGQPVINSAGRFSLAADLPNATNLIDVAVRDAAGNENSTVLTVYVDLVPPTVKVGFPRMGQHFGRRNITLNGTTEPFATVTAGDFTGVAGADGFFLINLTLLYGNNTLILRSTDRAGNYETLTWYAVRDRPPSGRESPWVPALLAFTVLLVVENSAIFLYWRRRGGRPSAAAPGTAGAAARPQAVPAKTGPDAPKQAVPEATAEPVPQEALPVGGEEPAETVDMK